jgi:hypothetical protein
MGKRGIVKVMVEEVDVRPLSSTASSNRLISDRRGSDSRRGHLK